jgi:Polycystin cation channel
LKILREQRSKELQMRSILHEIFMHLSFLILVTIIAHSFVQSSAFQQVQHFDKVFSNARSAHANYRKDIRTVDQYWLWLERSFLENIRAQAWYNGHAPRNLSGYIDDKTNRLIGWATMRQLRITPTNQSCRLSTRCTQDYSFADEDRRDFQPGWRDKNEQINQSFSASIQRAFEYQAADDLDSSHYTAEHHTYRSGGYIYEFRGRRANIRANLSQLHRLHWINEQTRAVIIHFNLYNPNLQLFIAIHLSMEFLSMGLLHSHTRFQPVALPSQSFSPSSHLSNDPFLVSSPVDL